MSGKPKSQRHGESKTRLYKVWGAMRYRCEVETCEAYKGYGARGISVCDEWQSFTKFRDWSLSNGYRQGLSLERKDNNGPYSPGNCCWATHHAQDRNKRTSKYLSAYGEEKILIDWSKDSRCRVSFYTLRHRIRSGWAVDAALSTQPSFKNRQPLKPRDATGRFSPVRD